MKTNLFCHPNQTMMTRALAALLSCLLATALFGETLKWETEAQHFETGFYDESVTATYGFLNASERPVTIVESTASCGCTVPSLDKTTYEPGETGELTAIFTIGSRQGTQRKVITVVAETADGEKETYELKLNVDIPVPVTLKPRVRFWRLSETADTQSIEVAFHEKMKMNITGLKTIDAEPSAFDYKIETLDPGLRYRIDITPKTPNQKSKSTFLLVAEEDRRSLLDRYPIYAYVR